MRRKGLAVLLSLLCTALALVGAPAAAAPRADVRSVPRAYQEQPSALARVWHHLVSAWGAVGGLVDPDGKPARTEPTPGDAPGVGGLVDPDGAPAVLGAGEVRQ